LHDIGAPDRFHFHLIPKFYQDAAYEAGTGPVIGRYPDWSPSELWS